MHSATEAMAIIAAMRRQAVNGKLYVTPSRFRYLWELVQVVERAYGPTLLANLNFPEIIQRRQVVVQPNA